MRTIKVFIIHIVLTGLTASMAMFKTGLTAIRSNEQLILNKDKHVFVNGAIAQYLLNHQINGVRFLYRNYEKVRQIERICNHCCTYLDIVRQHKQSLQLFCFVFCF